MVLLEYEVNGSSTEAYALLLRSWALGISIRGNDRFIVQIKSLDRTNILPYNCENQTRGSTPRLPCHLLIGWTRNWSWLLLGWTMTTSTYHQSRLCQQPEASFQQRNGQIIAIQTRAFCKTSRHEIKHSGALGHIISQAVPFTSNEILSRPHSSCSSISRIRNTTQRWRGIGFR